MSPDQPPILQTHAHPPAALGLLLVLLVGAPGCMTSAVASGHNTALDGMDLVQMTDHMAASIAGSPAVNRAIEKDGQLRIVIQPVENRMTAEVLPRGAAEAFTGRVRALLSRHAPDRFIWLMNRDDFERLRRRERELDFELGPPPDAITPEYALVARFFSVTDESSRRRTSYYLCVYELTNIQNRSVLWNGKYEVKKTAVKGFLD